MPTYPFAQQQSLVSEPHHDETEDVSIVLDGSPSMFEMDYYPDRLTAAKESACLFAELRRESSPEDRIGVVSFCETAHRECNLLPVSTKFDKIVRAINRIQTGPCTAIGAGLQEAENMFSSFLIRSAVTSLLAASPEKKVKPPKRRVILLTDGDQNAGIDPFPVAERMKRKGISIDIIGIGGSPFDVNEPLLKTLCSIDPIDRQPRYRFIADRDELLHHFRQLATGLCR